MYGYQRNVLDTKLRLLEGNKASKASEKLSPEDSGRSEHHQKVN